MFIQIIAKIGRKLPETGRKLPKTGRKLPETGRKLPKMGVFCGRIFPPAPLFSLQELCLFLPAVDTLSGQRMSNIIEKKQTGPHGWVCSVLP